MIMHGNPIELLKKAAGSYLSAQYRVVPPKIKQPNSITMTGQ